MLKTISYLLIAATLLAGTPVLAAPTSSLQISGHILGDAPAGLTVQATASDPYYRRQKYLSTLKIPAAWDVTTGTATTIAVIDTGINRQHPEFSGRLWVNADEVPGNGRDDDNNGFVDDINGYTNTY